MAQKVLVPGMMESMTQDGMLAETSQIKDGNSNLSQTITKINQNINGLPTKAEFQELDSSVTELETKDKAESTKQFNEIVDIPIDQIRTSGTDTYDAICYNRPTKKFIFRKGILYFETSNVGIEYNTPTSAIIGKVFIKQPEGDMYTMTETGLVKSGEKDYATKEETLNAVVEGDSLNLSTGGGSTYPPIPTKLKTINNESIVGEGNIETVGRKNQEKGETFNHVENVAVNYAHAEGGGKGEVVLAPSPLKLGISKEPADTRSVVLSDDELVIKIPKNESVTKLYDKILEPYFAAVNEGWAKYESLSLTASVNGEYIPVSNNLSSVILTSDYLLLNYFRDTESVVYTFNALKSSWDDGNRTNFAMGEGGGGVAVRALNYAFDYASHAEGLYTRAAGEASHAEGKGTFFNPLIAEGMASHAEGNCTKASGEDSHAEGNCTKASGEDSHAEGYNSEASGDFSHAEGNSTAGGGGGRGNGACAHAEGYSIASHAYSHAEGYNSVASGDSSHAEGFHSVAENCCQHSQGTFNTLEQTPSSTIYDTTKIIFSVGNGTSDDKRSDALKMLGNGTTWIAGAVHNPQADYAEMFEWLDGNTTDEDRVGYFVTMKNDKIVKATSTDKYILGIISAAPAIIGDNPNLWHGQYINDEWGRPIYEDVEVKYTETERYTEEEYKPLLDAEIKRLNAFAEPIPETLNEDEYNARVMEQARNIRKEAMQNVPRTHEVEKTRTDHIRKINPEWDTTKPYVDRTQRKEWDAVGLMGKLLVRHNGTLIAGGFCKPNDEGIASSSAEGYYVMKVLNDRQALVMFR